jgi:hypothetical protein
VHTYKLFHVKQFVCALFDTSPSHQHAGAIHANHHIYLCHRITNQFMYAAQSHITQRSNIIGPFMYHRQPWCLAHIHSQYHSRYLIITLTRCTSTTTCEHNINLHSLVSGTYSIITHTYPFYSYFTHGNYHFQINNPAYPARTRTTKRLSYMVACINSYCDRYTLTHQQYMYATLFSPNNSNTRTMLCPEVTIVTPVSSISLSILWR